MKITWIEMISFLKRKSIARDIFIKIFLIILLVILPSIAIVSYSKLLMTNSEKRSNSNYLTAVSSALDSALFRIRDKGSSIINGGSFYKLLLKADKYDGDFILASRNMVDLLSRLYTYDNIIDNPFIYFKNSNFLLTTTGSSDMDVYLNEQFKYSSYQKEFWDGLLTEPFQTRILPSTKVYRNNAYYKTIIPMLINIENVDRPHSYMVINIDQEKISKSIGNLDDKMSNRVYLVSMSDKKVIYSMSNDDMNTNFLNKLLDKIGSNESGSLESAYGNEKYIVSYKASSWNGLLYLVITPFSALFEGINKFLLVTIIIIIVFTSIGIVFTAVFSKGIYSPVYDLVYTLRNISKIPYEKSKNEFDYIKDTLSDFHEKQQKNVPYLSQIYLYRAINGSLSPEDIKSLFDNYGFSYSGYFAVVVAYINYPSAFGENLDKLQQDNFKNNLYHIFENAGQTLKVNENEYVAILAQESEDGIRLVLEQMAGTLQMLDESQNKVVHLVLGLSDTFADMLKTAEYYRQACDNINERNTAYGKMIYTKYDRGYDQRIFLSNGLREIMQKHLQYGNIDDIMKKLQEVFANARGKEISFRQYKLLVSEMIILALEFIGSRNISYSDVFGDNSNDLITTINSIYSSELLENTCTDVYMKVFESTKANKSKSTIEYITEYINQNLSTISLASLSDKLEMNPNYLSQYIRKQLGITFMEYVNKKRIEKAKELLLSTNMTGNEIGQKIGFNNPNTFIRMFKKIEGITPNEFKKENKKI